MDKDVKTLAAEVESLLAKRETLRASAAADPRQQEIRDLTDEIVRGKLTKADVSSLEAERDELHQAVRADVVEISAQISAKRKQLRAAKDAALASTINDMTDEDLVRDLAKNLQHRRDLKFEARAMRRVLNDRQFRATSKDLVAGMTAEARAAMLAELQASE